MPCPRCGDRCTCACSGNPFPTSDWRHEVALQVRAHKARKRRGQDVDSAQLEFRDDVPVPETSTIALRAARWRGAEESSAIAVEAPPTTECPIAPVEQEPPFIKADEPQIVAREHFARENTEPVNRPPLPPFPRIGPRPRKVIEFPGGQTRGYELAEPVSDQLRIFEAVEDLPAPPLSHLNQIEIAPEEPSDLKLGDLEVPIHSAPIGARVYAAGVDAAVMIAAIALFSASAGCFVNSLPMSKPLLASGTVAVFIILTTYYLLSLCLRCATPGMHASGMSIVTFAGSAPSRLKLGCRALATVLSLAALGMGFAWSLIDDDQLCWHDRITHTYLTPKIQ